MKNAIFQYYLNFNGVGKPHLNDLYPENMPEWARRSSEYFKAYADKHDADYIFGNERFVESSSNYFEATRIFKDPMFDDYDMVLYADVDVMVKDMKKNVFKQKVKHIAGWPEWKHPDLSSSPKWAMEPALINRFAHFGSKLVRPETVINPIRMINSGLVLWTKEARLFARENFDDHEKWFKYKNSVLDPSVKNAGHSSHCLDQPYFNAMWTKFDMDVKELDHIWNRLPAKDENMYCVFAHYTGDSRYKIPELFPEL